MAAKARPQLWLVAVPRTAIWFSSLVFEAVPCLVTIVLWFLASKTMDFPYLSQLTGPIFTAFYWNMSDKLFRDFCHITSSRSLEKPTRFGWSYWAASECLDESVIWGWVKLPCTSGEHPNSWMMLDVHPHHRCWSILIIFPYPHFLLAVSIAGHDFSLNQFQYQWSDLVSTL